MKGIAHFSVGVALASFFQSAVKAGADGSPMYFILGGVFGLLPDTLDFKFYKFFYRYDIIVTPDPLDPDPQMIADGVAMAVNNSFVDKKPVRIKLNTIRMGSDLWRQYSVKFDIPCRKVVVSVGPVVRTDQSVVEEYSCKKKEAHSGLLCGVKPDYETETVADILDGPSFLMKPTADKRVVPIFIPWHREWSHSLVIGLLFALAGTVVWDVLAGMIIFGAFAAHILVDQLGFLGSCLLYPFRASLRTGGMKLIHSGDMLPNFGAVWFSCLAIFWNLYRALPWQIDSFNPLKLVFYGVLLPLVAIVLLRRLLSGHARSGTSA
ncbi:MAG: hypothetical protein A2283_10140 [Lentisphaerae bacterium RIFOXYA12_FULL_48_11]|nr:MAG: hypothetical protein A2283_10140 [Lentisphaerae bacterium RIFOXYA12_FULL_48_11]